MGRLLFEGRWLGRGPEDRSNQEARPLELVVLGSLSLPWEDRGKANRSRVDDELVVPAEPVDAPDVGDVREGPGVVDALPLARQQELPLPRLVHGELVGDGDLGFAVAIEV